MIGVFGSNLLAWTAEDIYPKISILY